MVDEQTRKAYDTCAVQYAQKKIKEMSLLEEQITDFLFKERMRILDLGSGPGQYAELFSKKGHEVLCVDASPIMIALCQEKNLPAMVMDIEHLHLYGMYDGIWANASLLHIPKERLPQIIKQLHGLLMPEGVLHVSVKEGTTEGYVATESYPGELRYYAYYQDEEVRALFSDFSLQVMRRMEREEEIFLNYLWKNDPDEM
ncbi:MAG: class I SAM-dependent methyltransferase [archaeon]